MIFGKQSALANPVVDDWEAGAPSSTTPADRRSLDSQQCGTPPFDLQTSWEAVRMLRLADREQRAARYEAFSSREIIRRRWVRATALAKHWADANCTDGLRVSGGIPWFLIDRGFARLADDIRKGFFEIGHRSFLLYLHPGIAATHMTADWLNILLANVWAVDGETSDLTLHVSACVWIPAGLISPWCEKHRLPSFWNPPSNRGAPTYDDAELVLAAQLLVAAGLSKLGAAKKVCESIEPESIRVSAVRRIRGKLPR